MISIILAIICCSYVNYVNYKLDLIPEKINPVKYRAWEKAINESRDIDLR